MSNKLSEEIGHRIWKKREELGLTLKDMSKSIGVESSALSNWESGQRQIKIDKLTLIASVLRVELSWLLLGMEAPSEQPATSPEESGSHKELITKALQAAFPSTAFTREEAVMAVWKRYPNTFGLRSFPHPDSNAVLSKFFGRLGVVGKTVFRSEDEIGKFFVKPMSQVMEKKRKAKPSLKAKIELQPVEAKAEARVDEPRHEEANVFLVTGKEVRTKLPW